MMIVAIVVIESTLTLKRLAKGGGTKNVLRSASLRWD